MSMNVRKEFEMTEEVYQSMLTKRGPVMLVGGVSLHEFAQLDANSKWLKLGEMMGFKGMTARPVPSKGPRFFTAEVVDEA